MQILVATLRGVVHQQQRAAAYAALLPSLMRIVKLVQRNISRQKCFGYLFRKIGVTAPEKRLRSLEDKIFRSAA